MKHNDFFAEIVECRNKKYKKEGHFYKRKDGDYSLILPNRPEIGLSIGNIVKMIFKNNKLCMKIYEPFNLK